MPRNDDDVPTFAEWTITLAVENDGPNDPTSHEMRRRIRGAMRFADDFFGEGNVHVEIELTDSDAEL